jgi:hypothetical protein
MRDGFYVHIDKQNRLVGEIITNQMVGQIFEDNVADKLIDYTEYDFSSLYNLILALRKSEIFDINLDVKYSDFEACKNGCELIAEAFGDEDEDPALKEYVRLKNMYKSRAERYENRTDINRERAPNDLTYDEFYAWSTCAAKERRRYIADAITAEEFLGSITM